MEQPPVRRLRKRTSQPSFSSSMRFIFGSRYEQSAGVTVSDTTSEAMIETMYAMPSGAKSRPSMPPRAKSGMKTRMTRMVAKTMELRTSLDAS